MDRQEHERQYANSRKLAARARLFDYAVETVPWWRWVADHAALRAGERILEVGCGPGWFWAASADAVPADLELTLTDLSSGMVDEATAKVGGLGRFRVHSAVADVGELPFEDASFDAVVAMHMFYHVPDPARGMAEIARVLKPGGRAIVTTNGRDNMRELYALSADAFGVASSDPAAAIFGFEEARALMQATFGTVAEHPTRAGCASPSPMMSLTPSPPIRPARRSGLAAAFAANGGVLDVQKQTGVFVSLRT